VVAVTDNAGTSLATNSYDPWGIPAAANQGRFQYTGQAWLAELGMYYYKARIYSPTLGRFMQTDPIGYEDQINLYAYVGNDPINKGDSIGTEEQSWSNWIYSNTVGPGTLYDKAIAAPFWNAFDAVANSPLGDPGVGMAIEQAAPQGEAVGAALEAGARGIRAVSNFAREVRATRITVDSARYPQSAAHIARAQAAGHPRTLTINRAGATANRREALRGMPTKAGKDRDEYPPAMFKEGGRGASREYISPGDNRGSGASIANQCSNLKDSQRVTVTCR
jgi:RHS repeat-associated protein